MTHTHTPERLRCEVCDMPTLGDTLCNLHYEEQEKMTHTPGPWEINFSSNFPDQQTIQAVGSDRILALIDKADEQDNANAAYIVHACNAHEELVEALKAILDSGRYDDTGNFVIDCEPWDGQGDPPDTTDPLCLQAAWALIEAEAKAERRA